MPSIAALAPSRSWLVLALAGVSSLLILASVGADDIATRLAGRWRGAVIDNTLNVPLREVQVQLEPNGGGVAARWSTLDGGEASLHLEPSKRPGVLAPPVGGLQAMLGGADVPNPLESEPLLWGRRDERGLYIYRLELADDGRLALDRYAFEPGPDPRRLTFAVSRLGPGGEALGRVRADLEREGP